MRFALLGVDPAVQPLLEAIAASEQHQVSHVMASPEFATDTPQLFPAARVLRGWDVLLGEPIDIVLVAGADAQVLEGAKHLAAGGKRLAVFPAPAQPAEWVYELTLIEEAECRLLPVFEHRVHPQIRRLRALTTGGSLGGLLHLHLERKCRVRAVAAGTPLLSRSELDAGLLPDVDLLRLLGGDYDQVTATWVGAQDAWFSASVAAAGAGLPAALWVLQPATEESAWHLNVAGERGRLLLSGADPGGEIELVPFDVELPDAARDSTHAPFDAGAAILEQFESFAGGGPTVFGTWSDLVRAIDLVAAAHRSVRRGRTIDVHFETTSERSQFKTQMTALGCGVLFLTFLGVVLVLLAGAALDPRSTTEIAADAAGSIVPAREFETDSDELTGAGRAHVEEIAMRAERFSDRPFPILVEEDRDARWVQARRQRVARLLEDAGIEDADRRTVSAPLRGREFNTAMRVARIAVWVPLLVFLLLQALLFVARPAPAAVRPGDSQKPVR